MSDRKLELPTASESLKSSQSRLRAILIQHIHQATSEGFYHVLTPSSCVCHKLVVELRAAGYEADVSTGTAKISWCSA